MLPTQHISHLIDYVRRSRVIRKKSAPMGLLFRSLSRCLMCVRGAFLSRLHKAASGRKLFVFRLMSQDSSQSRFRPTPHARRGQSERSWPGRRLANFRPSVDRNRDATAIPPTVGYWVPCSSGGGGIDRVNARRPRGIHAATSFGSQETKTDRRRRLARWETKN